MLFKLVIVFELLIRSRTSYYILHLILHFKIIGCSIIYFWHVHSGLFYYYI